ncbi:hypothetical protein [Altererythrobacter sp. GH1-8]|uniref:hypothetical protein n=1 Tax=Altererythrobacter sp. GH1-8 TaxID=3349333 RepID=UPI00374D7ED1
MSNPVRRPALASRTQVLRAGLGGLALLLCACGNEPVPPGPTTPDEAQALAEAEEMIAAGRPGQKPAPAEPKEN